MTLQAPFVLYFLTENGNERQNQKTLTTRKIRKKLIKLINNENVNVIHFSLHSELKKKLFYKLETIRYYL